MLQSFIIVFREVFEMVIVVSLLMAATKGLPKSKLWIFSGVGVGAALSLGLGAMALNNTWLAQILKSGITNSIILLLAATLIAWTVIWMKTHGKQLSSTLKQQAQAVKDAQRPLSSLALVAGMAVFREGAETVIFLMGLVGQDASSLDLLQGGVMGVFGASICGVAMYYGLVRINIKKLFDVCAVLMSLLAAGMAANAAAKLVTLHLLPAIILQVWDSSSLLDDHSNYIGRFLHVLIGYTNHPNLMQVIFYITTLVMIYFSLKYVNFKNNQKPTLVG